MTILRQYNLPNCTLLLEGMSESVSSSPSDSRPLMSLLIGAECRFAGREQTLSGGREFLESLVTALSRYAQEVLSGVPHPIDPTAQPSLVEVRKIEGNLHRLTLHSPDGHSVAKPASPTHFDLTTVQLFDLVEAVDQFFADSRTLPELSLRLTPVSKKSAQTYQPVARRAMPAAIGVSTLAAAAIAASFFPIPDVRRPTEPVQQSGSSNNTLTNTSANSNAGASPPSASELETALSTLPEITDPNQLEGLKWKLYDQIDRAWKRDNSFGQELVYRVGVGQDGAIVGYKPANQGAIDAKETPLSDLVYIPPGGGQATPESLAQFKVVLSEGGDLQVSPWKGYTADPSQPPDISDPGQLEDLQDQLYKEIDRNWKNSPSFERELIYRVGINPDGTIANFTPLNQPAFDYVQETPLEKLQQPASAAGNSAEGAGTQQQLAQFRVVFTPRGVLQVSPWKGYR
ncbi:MAG: DUF4335 domain-containing protein [Microcoleus vaginatus WJT46-NPBG5]|nr:DUF4335 domain-containing protein [Microcoleus vaginatus WJT46-NPBG5]